ncbi:MAG: hypothetical protein QOJ59_2292 [Thermomicrobiales bacterium]|jgi:phospholipase C|nr:hypothetical protein [Thermomicrobiales bacterium]
MIRRAVLLVFPLLLLALALRSVASADAQERVRTGPKPSTPIEHFVVLMQENHSFDNYFGTYPRADGVSLDVCMPVDPTDPDNNECVRPFHIGGHETADLSHIHRTQQRQYRNGAMDGFVWAHRVLGENGDLAMGYYDDRDLSFYWNVADEYVLFDRFFSSAKGGSVANHMFWMTGQAGVESIDEDSIPPEGWGNIRTIFDLLEENGVSWKVYVQNYKPEVNFRTRGERGLKPQLIRLPLLSIPRFVDDPELSTKIVDVEQYYEDLRNDALPAVSFIVPVGASEQPPGSISAGQLFVKRLINALTLSSAWSTSAFMWTYDDWGGWYDHVPPPAVDQFGYGFRVPALLVSPYAKQGYVESTTLDFTSILKFIEENFHLQPLAERDAAATSIASAFDFTQPARPPSIVSSVRNETGLAIPWRAAIYGTYGMALLVPVLVIGAALLEMPGRPRRLPTIRISWGKR